MDNSRSRINEARNIIEQTRDAEAAFAAGALDLEGLCKARGQYLASLDVLARAEAGENVTDEEYLAMIDKAANDSLLHQEQREVVDSLPDAMAELSGVASDNAVVNIDMADALAELSAIVSEMMTGGNNG